MKRALPLLGLLVLGCGPKGAISAVVQFKGMIPGCVRTTAIDETSDTRSTGAFPVDAARGQHHVAIYPEAKWGETITVQVEGLEHDCAGAAVSRADTAATFPDRGFNEVTLILEATDADGDGFVSSGATIPGTDCDDADPARAPGLTETCDGKDNDCNGIVDDAC